MKSWSTGSALISLLSFATTSLAAVALSSSMAIAGDWSLDSKFSESANFNDNYLLSSNSKGAVFGSITDLYFDLSQRSYDHRFDFIGDVKYQNYWGPGENDVIDGFTPRLQLKFNQKGKTTNLDLSASYARENTSGVDVLDPANLSRDLIRNNLSIDAALTETLNAIDSIGFSTSLNDVIYDNAGSSATPSVTTDLSAFWNHRLTKQIDLKSSVGLNLVSLEDQFNTTRLTYRLREDVTAQISKTLKFKAGAGLRMLNQGVDGVFPFFAQDITSTSVGWFGDANLDYTYKRGMLSASASFALEPGVLGDLQNRTTFGVAGDYNINQVSKLGLGAQYRITSLPSSSNQNVFTISPTYTYRFTDKWSLQTSYRWTYQDGGNGVIQSNSVFLSISNSMVLDP
jgi:hypothetical protein